MKNIRNDRAQSRQETIDNWFSKFVENGLYDQSDYHSFCKRVKDMNTLRIERIFEEELKTL